MRKKRKNKNREKGKRGREEPHTSEDFSSCIAPRIKGIPVDFRTADPPLHITSQWPQRSHEACVRTILPRAPATGVPSIDRRNGHTIGRQRSNRHCCTKHIAEKKPGRSPALPFWDTLQRPSPSRSLHYLRHTPVTRSDSNSQSKAGWNGKRFCRERTNEQPAAERSHQTG